MQTFSPDGICLCDSGLLCLKSEHIEKVAPETNILEVFDFWSWKAPTSPADTVSGVFLSSSVR